MLFEEFERAEKWKNREEEEFSCYTCGKELKRRKWHLDGMYFCSRECQEEVGDV